MGSSPLRTVEYSVKAIGAGIDAHFLLTVVICFGLIMAQVGDLP